MDDLVTHKADGGTTAGRMCKCSRCGVERRCTPDFDFYGEVGQPLVCQTCTVQSVTGHPDGPLFELTPGRVICAQHGEPFRRDWPAGYPTFALQLLQPILAVTSSLDELGRQLDKQPACCRMEKAQLLTTYLGCGIGVMDRCRHCRQRQPGTPYSVSLPGGAVEHIAHLCFRCVVFHLAPRTN